MIRLYQKLPRSIGVAVSGGVDSMAALDFLRRSHEVTAFIFDHNDGNDEALQCAADFCAAHSIPVVTGRVTRVKFKGESREEYWRNERYAFLHSYPEKTIAVAHHLDDCVESWIFSFLHGDGKLIPYRKENVVRPFLLSSKEALRHWATRHSVPWVEDCSNFDVTLMRNHIRHELLPKAHVVNPGLRTMILKKLHARKREE